MESSPQPRGGRRRGRRGSSAGNQTSAGVPAAFVDSSAIVALVDRNDATHNDAVAAYRSLVADDYRLFTTNHVMVETYSLLCSGLGPEIAQQWLRGCNLAIYTADLDDEEQARQMVLNADSGKLLTMTDAISAVVMQRLGVRDVFAVDPDFFAALP